MNDRPIDHAAQSAAEHSRLRFELIAASVLLAFGLFVLPALIFWVGRTLLGPYGEGQGAGLGTFYGDLFGDLAAGSVRAWAVAVGPLVLISLLRLIFLRKRIDSEPAGTDEDRPSPPRQKHPTPADPRRVEPRVSLD